MEINIKDAKCSQLSLTAPVKMAAERSDGNSGFLIEAYTGQTVERWYGALSIAVDGIQAKQAIPIFLNHNPEDIVGHSVDTYIDNSFFVAGQFSEVTKAAKETRELSAEGFPWQASIGVRPLKVLSLEKDNSHIVNGQFLTGPAEIWLESEVFETSFVPLGADDKTNISVFSKFTEAQAPKGVNPKEEVLNMTLTMERLQEDAPELLADIQAKAMELGQEKGHSLGLKEGATAERERIQAVLAQSMPGHEEIIEKLAFDGETQAPEAAMQILAAEKQIRTTVAASLADDGVAPVTPSLPGEKKKVVVTKENFEQQTDLYFQQANPRGDLHIYLHQIQLSCSRKKHNAEQNQQKHRTF